jgi:hypothetical protein
MSVTLIACFKGVYCASELSKLKAIIANTLCFDVVNFVLFVAENDYVYHVVESNTIRNRLTLAPKVL